MVSPARPTTWIVAGSSSWASVSSPAPSRQVSSEVSAGGRLTVADEREEGAAIGVRFLLEQAHPGAGLAPCAACRRRVRADAPGVQVGHDPAIDRLAVLR